MSHTPVGSIEFQYRQRGFYDGDRRGQGVKGRCGRERGRNGEGGEVKILKSMLKEAVIMTLTDGQGLGG